MLRPFALVAALLPLQALATDPDLTALTWDEIVEQARGGTVNWFMWGGADNINAHVDDYVGGILMRDYGITLNRVPITDTADVVNQVLGEKQAGNLTEGAVDLIWINGENFRAMKAADLAFCGYTQQMPNATFVNWDDPSIANDFGVPVDGCEVPWARAQFALAHDSASMPRPPADMAALLDWIRANPGQFTYPAPPDFTGSVFVRHVFYHAAGGPDGLLGPFDQARFDAVAPKAWEILNGLEPLLWREGATYPTSITQLNDLFANGEVAMTFNYDASQFGIGVEQGLYPETVRSFGLTDGTIGNTNYTLIPFNSPNKAAAMVLQNVLLDPAVQLEKARPAVWGAAPAIDITRADAAVQADFAALPRHPSVIAPEALAAHALPELQADWIEAIEAGWLANVAN
jgi:putative spermidine/putrescine transport system substrate-binding protein